jgi:hypothetical protein
MSDPDQMASAGSEHVVGNLQHAFECSTRQRALSATSIVLLSFSIALADHLLDFAAQVHTDVNAFLALDEYHGVKLVAVWGVMLQGAFPELCVRKYNSLDRMLLALILRCKQYRCHDATQLHDFIEYGCGGGALTLECLREGLCGVGLDKLAGLAQNALHPLGLRLWVNELSVTRDKAVTWFGTQCSSFVPLCLSTSKRSCANGYLGDETRLFVREGNALMNVTALLMLLSFWLGNVPVLEQPLGSVMPKSVPLQSVLAFMDAKRVVTWHKAFGAKSMKPFQILSPSGIICELRRDKPAGKSIALVRKNGDRFTGIKRRLVASGAYAQMFGAAVAKMVKKHLAGEV